MEREKKKKKKEKKRKEKEIFQRESGRERSRRHTWQKLTHDSKLTDCSPVQSKGKIASVANEM